MSTLLKPVETYDQANGFGYWKDDNGKTCVDYIKSVYVKSENVFEEAKKLFALGEKAVFVIVNEEYSQLINADYSSVVLKNHFFNNNGRSKKEKDKIIKENGGLTVFKSGLGFYAQKV